MGKRLYKVRSFEDGLNDVGDKYGKQKNKRKIK